MTQFHLFVPIEVRYGDIDAQGHVNNSRFLTYIEQARFKYLRELELWDGQDFMEVGLIVADVHIAYKAPIELNQPVRVGVCVARIGNKSLVFEYEVADAETGQLLATAETVMVAYDYHTKTSKPVPAGWREKIARFEGG